MRKILSIGAGVAPFVLLSSSLFAAELPFTVSGAVEVEAFSANDEISPATDPTAKQRTNDVVLATVALAVDAEINDRVSAHIGFLYEDNGATPFDVDDATIDVLLTDKLSLVAGKAYLPFGRFDSHMVSDPLTLEMAETLDSAIILNMGGDDLSASVFAFNRDSEELAAAADNDDDEIGYGAAVGYASETFELGASYISSIAESDGFKGVTDPAAVTLDSPVPGAAAFVAWGSGNFSVIAEYVTATSEFKLNDFGGGVTLRKEQPSASNVELGYSFSETVSAAVAYQQTEEAQFMGLPESVASVAVSYAFAEGTTLSAEYADGDDYEVSDGGTGKGMRVATLQLAVEF